jgi:hypothetical protein
MSNSTLKLYNYGTSSMGWILTMNTCHEHNGKPPLFAANLFYQQIHADQKK